MEYACICLYFLTAIWYNLWPFGIVDGHLLFSIWVCLFQEKYGNPANKYCCKISKSVGPVFMTSHILVFK
jgi:hypothetical protein